MAEQDDVAARLEQVKEAARTGNLVIANEAFHKGAGSVSAKLYRRHNAEVFPEGEQGVLIIQWSRAGKGFGELTITARDGKLVLDTECMSRETVKDIVLQAINEADIVG